MSQNLSSAAVVIGVLRVKMFYSVINWTMVDVIKPFIVVSDHIWLKPA